MNPVPMTLYEARRSTRICRMAYFSLCRAARHLRSLYYIRMVEEPVRAEHRLLYGRGSGGAGDPQGRWIWKGSKFLTRGSDSGYVSSP